VKPVIVEESAERELTESFSFYEERSAGLGYEFKVAAWEAVLTIQRAPEINRLRHDGTRRYTMRRFPFVIHYLEMPDYLWIVAFAHTSRKPDYWRIRLRREQG